MNEKWSVYYRGSFANWAGLLKSHKTKITNPVISKYLDVQEKLNNLIVEMNKIEREAENKFSLLNILPASANPSENDSLLDEIVIYVNAKTE